VCRRWSFYEALNFGVIGLLFCVSGVPPGTKPPPGGHLLPSLASQNKHHRSGAPSLPGGHTVPGPGPGVAVGVPPTQPPSSSGGRSFAAALRNLAKQAVPPAERDSEGEPTPAPHQVSPKRGPPPLVRGASPTSSAAQDTRKVCKYVCVCLHCTVVILCMHWSYNVIK